MTFATTGNIKMKLLRDDYHEFPPSIAIPFQHENDECPRGG